MKKFTKIALIVASFVLVAALSVGATIAWLTDSTATVTNTFVKGEIEINLDEGEVYEYDDADTTPEKLGKFTDNGVTRTVENEYQVIPGNVYDKDPTVTVYAKSEKCWLFVEFTETGDPDEYYTYESMLTEANGWYQDSDIPENVWYRIVEDTNANQSWKLLVNDAISVKEDVGQDDMAAAEVASLEWKAYAVQFANLTTVEAAWAECPTA